MWAFISSFVLEAVAITAANAATIVLFIRTPRLHSKQYIMIISQAVADFLVGLVSVPLYMVVTIGATWRIVTFLPILKVLFAIYLLVDSFIAMASLFGLAALAVERAHATFFPFRHSTLGNGPYIAGIVLMWLIPLFVASPYLLIFVDSNRSLIQIMTSIKISFISFALLTICAAYFLIFVKVRCSNTQVMDVNMQENRKLTITLAVVTILSLAIWLPYQCMTMIRINVAPPAWVIYSGKFLQFGNSIVNSVIYAFRMREVKREILRMCVCYRRNNQVSPNNETELVTIK